MTVKELLSSWCGYLLSKQAPDGGFYCDSCDFEHGRADNAVLPFLCMFSFTKDERWLSGADRLLNFRQMLTNPDGSVCNDFASPWKGITVFSAMGLNKALERYSGIIPGELALRIENCFRSSAIWVHENIKPGFRANVNYYCAAAAVNAMFSKRYGSEEYRSQAKELLEYCLGLFTENGILTGEGQPFDFKTAGGCVPADIGYLVEESLPALTDAALLLGDNEALDKLAGFAVSLLGFMLPDGAWDNSMGSRNNKWTYYGSRTASGCAGAFFILGKYRTELTKAAMNNIALMSECTFGGALAGGPEYEKYGRTLCVHHTFSHALSLADAVAAGFGDAEIIRSAFCGCGDCRKYYPELRTYKIRSGKWLATVTANDYSTYTWKNGAAHSSGGALSMLYHSDCGPVIAGSVSEYFRTETNNMQDSGGSVPHRSLIPRLEITRGGKTYSTSFSFDCSVGVSEKDGVFTFTVFARPETAEHEGLPGGGRCGLVYRFDGQSAGISAIDESVPEDAVLIVPVIASSGAGVIGKTERKERIFFLAGGFGADEYVFAKGNMNILITGKKDY